MKKFKVVIEDVVTVEENISASRLANLFKKTWYLQPGEDVLDLPSGDLIGVKYGKFTVTATELKK